MVEERHSILHYYELSESATISAMKLVYVGVVISISRPLLPMHVAIAT